MLRLPTSIVSGHSSKEVLRVEVVGKAESGGWTECRQWNDRKKWIFEVSSAMTNPPKH
jgi:hypothetical protein